MVASFAHDLGNSGASSHAFVEWKKPALWEIYGDLLVTSSYKLLRTSYNDL